MPVRANSLLAFADQMKIGEEMQQRQETKKSRLRALLLWALGVVVAVPITKQAESHYDVSFFSPAIVWIWSGIVSASQWIGRDVTWPFWIFLVLIVLVVLLTVPFLILVLAKLDSDSTPLTDSQMRVFITVGKSIEVEQPISLDGLVRGAGFSRIAAHAALDVLVSRRLITPARDSWGLEYIDLTSTGRAYFLSLSN